jgi:hypothetical protein
MKINTSTSSPSKQAAYATIWSALGVQ